MKFIALTFILSSSLSYAGNPIKMATANAVYRSMWIKIVPEFEKKTGLKIEYIHDPNVIFSAHLSMQSVIEGKAEMATAANAFEDWIRVLKKELPNVNPSGLTHRIVGKDLIMVVTGKGPGVKGLEPQKIADIFTGKVKNWKEVGGKDLPITLAYQPDAKSRIEVIKKRVLKDAEFAPGIKELKTAKDTVAFIAANPGGVTFVPDDQVDEKTMVEINKEEIGRPITLIVKGKPSEEVMKFIQFVETEGKQILKAK